MQEIKFICVNYNRAIESAKLIDSLRRQKKQAADFNIRCIVVDNSTNEKDASECEETASRHSWVTYVRTPKNLGYFGGLNYGLSTTNCSNAAYVVVCNNDLEFEETFCEKLFNARYDEHVYSVCPDVITFDGIHQNPHILTRIGRFRRLQFDFYFAHYYISRLLLLILKVIRPTRSSPQQPLGGCELHMGVGACYVLTRGFLNRFKQLDYPHFMYGEEAYISNQIHSAGGILWFDPNLRVDHAESATLSLVPNRTAYEFARCGYSDYRRLL